VEVGKELLDMVLLKTQSEEEEEKKNQELSNGHGEKKKKKKLSNGAYKLDLKIVKKKKEIK
jgi:hypothetical protein